MISADASRKTGSRPKIAIVGSTMVDLITYISRMPQEGETIEAPRFEMGFGGKGANQAVAAAMMGAEVSFIARIGDDLFGPATRQNLESYGIDTSHVDIAPGVSSGVAPIFVDPASLNSILIIKGANACLLPSDIDRAADAIHASDLVIMQLEIGLDTVYYTIDLCREAGIPVILNPAPVNPYLNLEKIDSVFLIAPNETELKTLTGMPTESLHEVKAAAKSLTAMGFLRVLVTLGDKGSFLVSGEGEVLVPAPKVKSADTTGAGDAFIGCFAVLYLETQDFLKAMEGANRYAALSTMRNGTQKSFPDRKSFEAAIF
ncbi:MAG: ribokinase [Spirochaetes bacterium]|nr:ribokinase [Spirochaetota bacterium]